MPAYQAYASGRYELKTYEDGVKATASGTATPIIPPETAVSCQWCVNQVLPSAVSGPPAPRQREHNPMQSNQCDPLPHGARPCPALPGGYQAVLLGTGRFSLLTEYTAGPGPALPQSTKVCGSVGSIRSVSRFGPSAMRCSAGLTRSLWCHALAVAPPLSIPHEGRSDRRPAGGRLLQRCGLMLP